MRDLLGSSSMFSSASGKQLLAQQYELSSDTLDSLLRYVAVPQLEKRREDTKELDAVWPSWKRDLSLSVCSHGLSRYSTWRMSTGCIRRRPV